MLALAFTGSDAVAQADAPASKPAGGGVVERVGAGSKPLESSEGTTQAFVAPEAQILRNLEIEAARLQRELRVQELRGQIAEASRARDEGPGSQASRSFPELLGVRSARGKSVAEFLVGDGVMEFGVGEFVTPEWQVSSISANGVELRNRGGARQRMAVGVSKPVPGGFQGASPTMPRPMSQPPMVAPPMVQPPMVQPPMPSGGSEMPPES
jgi:hypothetical protein